MISQTKVVAHIIGNKTFILCGKTRPIAWNTMQCGAQQNDNLTPLQLCNNWHVSTGQNSNTAGLRKDQKMEASKTIERSRNSKI